MTESTSTQVEVPDLTPEILHILAGDPAELTEVCAAYQPADVAVALRKLPAAVAASIIDNLPFDYAVQVFDQPEIAHLRPKVVSAIAPERAGALIEAMSADQQTDLFRELSPT